MEARSVIITFGLLALVALSLGFFLDAPRSRSRDHNTPWLITKSGDVR